MTAKIIDGKAVAQRIRQDIQSRVQSATTSGKRPPCLAVILAGDDPASQVYVGHKAKACETVGFKSLTFRLPATASESELHSKLNELNHDSTVDGILLQLPLPSHLSRDRALDLIAPAKDVDGLTPVNQGLLLAGRPALYPCTPLGVMTLIEETQIPLRGKLAAVVGQSILVGAPVSVMLSKAGATVININSKTVEPHRLTAQADILVAAAGVKHLITSSWIKPGAIVIDVGIHRGADNRLTGDVAYDEVAKIAGFLTPVPGGVGPMTIAMLLKNCLSAWNNNTIL